MKKFLILGLILAILAGGILFFWPFSRSRPLKSFILISFIFALANFSYMFFILRAKDFFTGKLIQISPLFMEQWLVLFRPLYLLVLGASVLFYKVKD